MSHGYGCHMCLMWLRTKGPPGKRDSGRDGKKKAGFTCVGNCHSRLYYLASCQVKKKLFFTFFIVDFPMFVKKDYTFHTASRNTLTPPSLGMFGHFRLCDENVIFL